MPYRIHYLDRQAIVTKLADLLATVPEEELAGLISEAEVSLRNREFPDNSSLGRNAQSSEPY